MPSYIAIENVGVRLEDVVDQEDADYAASRAPTVGDDLHTWTTLEEELAEPTRSTVPVSAQFA